MRTQEVMPAQPIRLGAIPRWVDKLFSALLVYAVIAAVCLLTGFCGPQVTHYLGFLCPVPAGFVSILLISVTARHSPRGALRFAWALLFSALALNFVGDAIVAASWLQGHDPHPGPADIFYCAFYLTGLLAALFFIRTAAVRVPWV